MLTSLLQALQHNPSSYSYMQDPNYLVKRALIKGYQAVRGKKNFNMYENEQEYNDISNLPVWYSERQEPKKTLEEVSFLFIIVIFL